MSERRAAVWSPDFDAYAEGRIGIAQVRCLMCQHAPCTCADDFPFGSDQYMARLREIHGRQP